MIKRKTYRKNLQKKSIVEEIEKRCGEFSHPYLKRSYQIKMSDEFNEIELERVLDILTIEKTDYEAEKDSGLIISLIGFVLSFMISIVIALYTMIASLNMNYADKLFDIKSIDLNGDEQKELLSLHHEALAGLIPNTLTGILIPILIGLVVFGWFMVRSDKKRMIHRKKVFIYYELINEIVENGVTVKSLTR
ncbi:hypothetical protein [Oceanobacillus oncorhynchi]|uniref:hypothetical protein n=1 Tax=Oceanobacillus oncorhynchi TaxID=545501 RepID=UPI00186728F9|nr:hypothetical protein [Oceanobacillus oncorhynchi]